MHGTGARRQLLRLIVNGETLLRQSFSRVIAIYGAVDTIDVQLSDPESDMAIMLGRLDAAMQLLREKQQKNAAAEADAAQAFSEQMNAAAQQAAADATSAAGKVHTPCAHNKETHRTHRLARDVW